MPPAPPDIFCLLEWVRRHDGLIHPEELAAMYRVEPAAIYKAANAGRIPKANLGLRIVRFDPTTLYNFLRLTNPGTLAEPQ